MNAAPSCKGIVGVEDDGGERAWRICRHCAGLGTVPGRAFEETGEFEVCLRCDGTGDRLAALLLRAYECGWRDAVERTQVAMSETRKTLDVGLEGLDAERPRGSVLGYRYQVRVLRERCGDASGSAL